MPDPSDQLWSFEGGEEEDGFGDGTEVANLEDEDGVSEGPVVRIVNSVILQASEDGASDVHFVPQADDLIVRFRIDGVLHEIQRIPKRLAAGVVLDRKSVV